MMLFWEDNRHSGVDLGDKFVWLSCDNRTCMNPFRGPWIFPSLPQTGKDEWTIIFQPN